MLSYLTNWLFRKTFLSAVCRYSLTDNLTDKVYWINLLVIPSLVCDVRRNVCWQGCLVSTWTSCMSSCLSSSIILTWKDVMVVQQPIFKYSNTDNIEQRPRTAGSHRSLTGLSQGSQPHWARVGDGVMEWGVTDWLTVAHISVPADC